VSSAFDDLSSFKYDNIIGMLDGLESVGDDENGFSFKKGFKSFSYCFLTETIKSGRWFIEDDDFWIFDKKLGNCQSLPLSSGESDSFFSDLCIDRVLEIVDKFTFCHLDCSIHRILVDGVRGNTITKIF